MTTKSLIEQFKAEWKETFQEKRDNATKQRVFTLLSELASVEEQIKANVLISEMLVEQKDKIEAEIAALE